MSARKFNYKETRLTERAINVADRRLNDYKTRDDEAHRSKSKHQLRLTRATERCKGRKKKASAMMRCVLGYAERMRKRARNNCVHSRNAAVID